MCVSPYCSPLPIQRAQLYRDMVRNRSNTMIGVFIHKEYCHNISNKYNFNQILYFLLFCNTYQNNTIYISYYYNISQTMYVTLGKLRSIYISITNVIIFKLFLKLCVRTPIKWQSSAETYRSGKRLYHCICLCSFGWSSKRKWSRTFLSIFCNIIFFHLHPE
jgi:hypothetical protein